MTDYELHRVCEDCFNESRNPPIREKVYNSDGSCRTCGRMWIGIDIAYYPLHRKWHKIRKRRYDSRLYLCHDKMSGRCMRGVKCRRAHNILELEIWTATDSAQRPGNRKFMCVICNEDFKIVEHLNSHMIGQAHVAKSRSMRILPEVGHSERYTGPIRSRPKLTFGSVSYELCHDFANQRRVCRYANGCKYAHSEEELKVWKDALKADTVEHRDKVYTSDRSSHPSSRSYVPSQGGASKYPSSSESRPHWYPEHSGTSDGGNDPDVLMQVYEAIDRFGLNACVLQMPNHIQLCCEGPDTVNIKADESLQVRYLVTLKATQPEFLNVVILYQHKGVFTLDGIYKCNVMGNNEEKIIHQHNVNKTNYLVFQKFDSDNFLEVRIIFRPQIGGHKVFVVFQLQDGLLLAREIYVKVRTEESSTVNDSFRKSTARPRPPSYTPTPGPGPTGNTQAPPHAPPGHMQAPPHAPPGHMQASPHVSPGHMQIPPHAPPGHMQKPPYKPPGYMQTPTHVSLEHIQTPSHVSPGHIQAPPHVSPGHIQTPPHVSPGHIQTPPHVSPGHIQTPPHVSPGHIQTPPPAPPGHMQEPPHAPPGHMQAPPHAPTGHRPVHALTGRVLPRPRARVVDNMSFVNWEHNYDLVDTSWYSNKYPMRNDIEERMSSGYFDNMKSEITKENYINRFRILLYLEEYQQKKSLMKYDLCNETISFDNVMRQVTIEPGNGREIVETAKGNFRFIRFELKHRLFEGYRSFRPPRAAYIIPNGTNRAFKCTSVNKASEYIILKITTNLITECQKNGSNALVRFTPDRDDYVKMHEAIDNINFSIVFPTLRKVVIPWNYIEEDHLQGLLDYERLSVSQKEAVFSIINLECHSFPTIVCGPFGCGKTRTLSVAAKLISRAFRNSRVLIVTQSNSCANMYIELLRFYFNSISMLREGLVGKTEKKFLFRHFTKKQNVKWNYKVNSYAHIDNRGYPDETYIPISLYDLQLCSIVVTTISSCHTLVSQEHRKSKSLFTHIFIDEAAQVTEPEVCVALSLADNNTKVVLAGDVRQTKPLILSNYGKKYNLDLSLMERFELLPDYTTESLMKCKVYLKENFRSRKTIVKFFSDLFYDGCIISRAPRLTGPINFPALSFIHASGQEQSLHGFPAFYNEEEAQLTIRALRKFVAAGVRVDRIALLTTYKAQEQYFSEILKQEGTRCRKQLHNTKYCRENNCINSRTIEHKKLEGIQGREYDLVIINTVRTVRNLPNDISMEEMVDLGLLDDVTQFNTILTRARGWVLVIGDVDCLTNVGRCSNVWNKYVEACEDVCGYFESIQQFNEINMRTYLTKSDKTFKKSLRVQEKDIFTVEPTKLFDNFNIQIPNKGNKSILDKIIPSGEENDVITTQELVSSNSKEELTLEETVSSANYNSKLYSLQNFINICHEELTGLTNRDVINVINEQIQFTNLTIELLERQNHMETRTSGNIPDAMASHRVVLDKDCLQGATPQVTAPPDLIPK